MFNFDQIYSALVEDERRWYIWLFLPVYLILKSWIFLYGLAYTYVLCFSVPWMLGSCCFCGRCHFPGLRGVHATGRRLGRRLADYSAIHQGIVWSVALRRGYMLGPWEQITAAAIAGLLRKCRSGPLEMVKAAVLCAAFYFVLASIGALGRFLNDEAESIDLEELLKHYMEEHRNDTGEL